MTPENEPVFPSPVEVDLWDVIVQADNSIRIWLRFQDDAYLALDFMPESEGHREILDGIGEAVNERLGRFGEHGVLITGVTAPDEEVESTEGDQ